MALTSTKLSKPPVTNVPPSLTRAPETVPDVPFSAPRAPEHITETPGGVLGAIRSAVGTSLAVGGIQSDPEKPKLRARVRGHVQRSSLLRYLS